MRGNVAACRNALSELACRLAYRAAIPWEIIDNCKEVEYPAKGKARETPTLNNIQLRAKTISLIGNG